MGSRTANLKYEDSSSLEDIGDGVSITHASPLCECEHQLVTSPALTCNESSAPEQADHERSHHCSLRVPSRGYKLLEECVHAMRMQ